MHYHITAGDASRTIASVTAQLQNLISAGHAEAVAQFFTDAAEIVAPSPAPVLDSIAPTEAQALGADVWIVCTGSGFNSRSQIYFNNGAENTTFVSETEVKTMFKGSTAATAGAYPVKVVTPQPGGGESASLVFTVTPAEGAGGERGRGGIRTGRRV